MLLPYLAIAFSGDVALASDPRLTYVGRFDRRNPAGPKCSWSASEIRFVLQGRSCRATLSEHGQDYWQVVVDGVPTKGVALANGSNTVSIDADSSGTHEIRLVKRTEPFVGTTQFLYVQTANGRFFSAMPRTRHIEVIGDSITCAYGNAAADPNEGFVAADEDAYQSYAGFAARFFGADVSIVAWSGRKMWPDNTIPSIYDLAVPTDATSAYDFSGPAPDAIVINLGTNDFAAGPPDQTQWTAAYVAFVRRLQSHYPNAHIYASIGSMLSDTWPYRAALSRVRSYLTHLVVSLNDRHVHYLEFTPQNIAVDGVGAGYHPSVKTHQKMAATLAQALHRDLGW